MPCTMGLTVALVAGLPLELASADGVKPFRAPSIFICENAQPMPADPNLGHSRPALLPCGFIALMNVLMG